MPIDCPRGHHFEAATGDELFAICRDHDDSDHPEMQRTDALRKAAARGSAAA